MPTYATADGERLHYDERGRADPGAPPLIVLAGGAGRHPDYLGDLGGVARRLVVPHLRGVGRSPMPPDATLASFWRQADDLEALRAHLGLARLTLVGHSAGTRLAMAHAARFPAAVDRLILVTPPVEYAFGPLVPVASDVDTLIRKRHGEAAVEVALRSLRAGPDTRDDAGLDAFNLQTAPLAYAAWGPRELVHACATGYRFAANQAFFSVDPPADLPARLGRVTAPVLVVAGAQDTLTGSAPVAAVASLFPYGSAVVIDGAGHHPYVEQPAAFREAVHTFLS